MLNFVYIYVLYLPVFYPYFLSENETQIFYVDLFAYFLPIKIVRFFTP